MYLSGDGQARSINRSCRKFGGSDSLVLHLCLLERVKFESRGCDHLLLVGTFLDDALLVKVIIIWELSWSHEMIQIHGTISARNQRRPNWALRVVEIEGRVVGKLAEELFRHHWLQILDHFQVDEQFPFFFFFFFFVSVIPFHS